MGKDLNSVSLIGRLVRDPELLYSSQGTPIAKFSVANNYSFKQGQEYKEEVNFFDVTVFGKSADNVYQYLKKGSQCCVHGELRQNRWQDKTTGQARSKVEILALSVQFLGSIGEKSQQDVVCDPWANEGQ